jgi:hypothetical protein
MKQMLIWVLGGCLMGVALSFMSGCGGKIQRLADTVEKTAQDAAAIANQPCGAALINAAAVCRANPPHIPQ